jgi:preprotein translocase subunit SecA
MMGRLGMPEDEPIQHSIISRALETAQEKIEGINFDARKHVLEFDDVINQQRSNIYRKRRKVLLGSVQDVEDIYFELIGNSESQSHTTPDMPIDKSIEAQTDKDAKSTEISKSLETKYAEFGRDNFLNALRIVILQVIDMYWVEHLEVMDYARSSVNLRAYGQRDPLVEYKKEGLRLFKEMQSAMIDQLERIVPNIVPTINGNEIKNSESNQNLKEVRESANAITADSHSQPSKSGEVGRNDLCPCGSGKKYKKCHGA